MRHKNILNSNGKRTTARKPKTNSQIKESTLTAHGITCREKQRTRAPTHYTPCSLTRHQSIQRNELSTTQPYSIVVFSSNPTHTMSQAAATCVATTTDSTVVVPFRASPNNSKTAMCYIYCIFRSPFASECFVSSKPASQSILRPFESAGGSISLSCVSHPFSPPNNNTAKIQKQNVQKLPLNENSVTPPKFHLLSTQKWKKQWLPLSSPRAQFSFRDAQTIRLPQYVKGRTVVASRVNSGFTTRHDTKRHARDFERAENHNNSRYKQHPRSKPYLRGRPSKIINSSSALYRAPLRYPAPPPPPKPPLEKQK